jgi:hypothetical protein
LGSVAGAYKDARSETKAESKLAGERQHEKDIANIRATASRDTPSDERYQNLRNELQEKKLEEVKNRLDATVPSKKREKGFFSNDVFDVEEDALPKREPVTGKEQSSLFNLQSSVPATASVDQPSIFSNMKDVSNIQPTTSQYSLSATAQPKTADLRVFPETEGTAVLGGQTLDLRPVTGAEGTLQPKPQDSDLTSIAGGTPKTEEKAKRQPTQYEIEQYYAGEPFESIADANYAKRQMAKLGYNAKVTASEDPTSKQRIYYVEFDEKKESEAPEGMVLREATRTDGKLTEKFEPKMKPEQKLPVIKGAEAQLNAMIKAVEDIEKLSQEGMLPEFGRASSFIKSLPVTTDAARVRPIIKTIQANTAFKTIMDMRKASPTGTGMGGSTSDKDLELLVSTLGSLDADNLDDPYITQNLQMIKQGAMDAKNDLELEKQGILSGNKTITPPTITNSKDYDALPIGSMYYAKNKAGEVKLMQKTEKSKK